MLRRTFATLAVAALSWAVATPIMARADEPPTGADVTAGCRAQQGSVPSAGDAVVVGPAACRTVTQGDWGGARGCRAAAGVANAADACEPIDGRHVSPADLAAYQTSWVHQALTLQRAIDFGEPLYESVLPHTHNTFNSSAYDVTLTNLDANQVYSITDQLQMDMRLIELDLHWVPSAFSKPTPGGYWVTLCHGDSGADPRVHIGCTNDRPFEAGLAELKAWLDAHPREFVVVYLENQLANDATGHRVAADLINAALPGLVEKPAAPCADMDWSRDRASMLQSGHRVVFVGDCGAGAGNAWGMTVFQRGAHWDEHGNPSDYPGACARDQRKHAVDHTFVRYFEDSTWLATMVDSNAATTSLGGASSISPAQAAAMVACGVNIIGLDQLTPTDARLPALVWSWAPGEPRVGAGDCALQGADGRFRAAECGQPKPVACIDPAQQWHVTAAAYPAGDGWAACPAEFRGTRFATPVNGLRNNQLVAAKGAVGDVWLNYRGDASSTSWRANAAAAPVVTAGASAPGAVGLPAHRVADARRSSVVAGRRPWSATSPVAGAAFTGRGPSGAGGPAGALAGRAASDLDVGPVVLAIALLLGATSSVAGAARRR